MRRLLSRAIPAVIALACHSSASAQRWLQHRSDSAYVVEQFDVVTARVYLSTKNNSFILEDVDQGSRLVYRPNGQVNIGFGASYRSLSLNIGFGLPVLNQDDDVRGKTSYFDAQANVFLGSWAGNFILQTYRGYYLDGHDKEALGWDVSTTLPFRDDVDQTIAGLSATRILNNERFSYRAAFTQDAWQRRSAGSWLVGGFLHVNTNEADSSLVPVALEDDFTPRLAIREGTFIDVGALGGYAHTFVLHERWFLTLSASGGLGIDHCWWTAEPARGEELSIARTGLTALGQGRAAVGYNYQRTYVGVSGNIESTLHSLGERDRYQWGTGNLRFNVARRLDRSFRSADRMLKKLK